MSLTTRGMTHRLDIAAPGQLVFRVLRDASHWPCLDGLDVYSELVGGDDREHDLRISVVADGALSSSDCRRLLDPAGLRILFEQSAPEAPLVRLAGSWSVGEGVGEGGEGLAVVTLSHEYEVEDGAAELSSWIHQSINDYGQRELAALKLSCERLAALLQPSGVREAEPADGRPVHH